METLNVSDEDIDNLCQNISIMESESSTPKPTKFPSDILKWMKIDAKPLMALKLMKICKYFQHQNFPYLVVKEIICWGGNVIYFTLDGTFNQWDKIEDMPSNLWITTSIDTRVISHGDVINRIIPKIAMCKIRKLIFDNEDISLNDFKVLTSSGKVIDLSLSKSDIFNDDDDKIVPLEDILSCVPNVEELFFDSSGTLFTSSEAAAKCILPNLRKCRLTPYKRDFNIDGFIEFMKIHKTVKFEFKIKFKIDFVAIDLLHAFVAEIIKAADLKFPPPDISFIGQNIDSYFALQKLRNVFYGK